MTNRTRKLIIWIPFLLITVGSIIYARKAGTVKIAGSTMGTTYSVKIVYKGSTPDTSIVKKGIDQLLEQLNQEMSTYVPSSLISQFNTSRSTEWTDIPKGFMNVMAESWEIFKKSGGAFDPTLGPAINLWGFGEAGTWSKRPSDADLKNISQDIGFDKIELDIAASRLKKLHPTITINLSAIAKGFAVDQVSAYLKSIGSSDHMVEIGGELKVSGHREDGTLWQIGIESPDPMAGSIEKRLHISNLAMATSGNYRNYFEKNGIRYSHIISNKTLSPVTHKLASVTVLGDNCGVADGWATALLALGPEDGLKIAEENGLAAYFIVKTDEKTTEDDSESFTSFSTSKFEGLVHSSQNL